MNVAPCGKSLTIGHINKSGMHWMFMPWRRDRMKKLIVMSSPNGGAMERFPATFISFGAHGEAHGCLGQIALKQLLSIFNG